MRYVVLAFLPFLAIFLQSTLFSSYSIKGSVPDLVLIFVVFHALFNGAQRGTIYGVLCGLLEDLYLGRFIGVNILAKGFTAWVLGKAQGTVFKENLLVGVLGVLVGTVINHGVITLLLFVGGGNIVGIEILRNMLYQCIYNMILTTPIYLWYYHSVHHGILQPAGESYFEGR